MRTAKLPKRWSRVPSATRLGRPTAGRDSVCVCVCGPARARPVCVCRFPRMSVFCPWTTYPLGYPSGPGTCPACPLGPYARCKRGDYRQPSSTPSRHSSMSSSTPCQPYPRSPSLASPALPFPPPHYPPRPHTAPLCAHPPHPPPPSWSGSLRAGRRSTAAHCWSTASQAQAGAPVTRRPGPWVICCCPCIPLLLVDELDKQSLELIGQQGRWTTDLVERDHRDIPCQVPCFTKIFLNRSFTATASFASTVPPLPVLIKTPKLLVRYHQTRMTRLDLD